MSSKPFSRLPDNCVPSSYSLYLAPCLTSHTFQGRCSVRVGLTEAVQAITCNSNNLEIESARVEAGGKVLEGDTVSISTDSEQETLSLALSQAVGPGEATIHYTFRGQLNDKMRGFYRSKYSLGGEERYAAVTQFEATDARQAFPCWDEPAVKATFDITIRGPKDRVILSNMPEIEVKDDPEDSSFKVCKFATTPIMSTYLVAIVVGEFDFLEKETEEGIKVRVYTPLGKAEQGRFALECGVRSLTFYRDFFNIPYPLTKYDMVAIPDFSSGAMENWGLVLYRELCLLCDPVNSSQSSKQWVAIVVCHETAHQWFGNLVTMEWWTHLWLNEGFASFMENLCTDTLYPEFKLWEQFVPGTLIEALKLDALNSSHPIEVDVGHPSEVDEIFDNISYNKGASVIRMMYHWIGEEAFKKGMCSYLTKYSYKNTETPQLWAELAAASGLPVVTVMASWTKQMGFPVISVESRQEGDTRLITLSQQKFVGDGSDAGNSSRWDVPVTLSWEGGTEKGMLGTDTTETVIRLEGVKEGQWVKLNPGVVGFYRTKYSQDQLLLLTGAVKSKSLPPVDRLNILDDLFALIAAGKASTSQGLRLLESGYTAEESYIVWNNISSWLSSLTTVLADQDCYPQLEAFILSLFSQVKSRVSWDPSEGESHLVTLLRSLVFTRLGRAGDQEVRREAKRRFSAHAVGGVQLSPDIRAAVYTCVAAQGEEEDFNTLLRLYKESDLHEEKKRIATSGLATFPSPAILSRVLEFAIGPEVRAQDSVHIIGSVARGRAGRDLCWQFFKDNFSMLKIRYESGFLLSRLVKSCSEGFLTEERAKEVEDFFSSNPLPGSERNVAQAVETIRLNSAWLQRDSQDIYNFFKK